MACLLQSYITMIESNTAILRKECNETFMNEEDILHYFEVPDDDEIDVRVKFN